MNCYIFAQNFQNEKVIQLVRKTMLCKTFKMREKKTQTDNAFLIQTPDCVETLFFNISFLTYGSLLQKILQKHI